MNGFQFTSREGSDVDEDATNLNVIIFAKSMSFDVKVDKGQSNR